MSLKTHKRTLTDSDIINFSNLTWDHFYAHTDITSLDGTIFEKRAVHGYFILAAAAGLFVYPNKGPVAANYGLDECRFLKPLYHNDTVYVRLTCKEKQDKDVRGKQFPAGVVKWFVEMYDQNDEKVAIATILTMVQKICPFDDIDRSYLKSKISQLKEDTIPKWGIMTSQHMIEHMEYMYDMAIGKIETEIATPTKHLEKYEDSLWNYIAMPERVNHPNLKVGETEDLRYGSLDEAIKALFTAYDNYEKFFEENPGVKTKNAVFGNLDKFHWDLLSRKHYHHHFKQFGLV
jgi:oxepin-CoA hydrolase/3-oxo-5,6-dehydrosuberyl-CoA semialdehyde dehydrogenase